MIYYNYIALRRESTDYYCFIVSHSNDGLICFFFFFICSDSEMAIPTACTSATDGSSDTEQPEPDYIKMFVGQIPRAMNEQDLMDMFGEFGRVYQLNLLRDKFTGVSKGKPFT